MANPSTSTVLSAEAREGLGKIADYFARALTSDSPLGDQWRYRAMMIALRFCGALDLWRLHTWEQTNLSPWFGYAVIGIAFVGVFRPMDRLATAAMMVAYWIGFAAAFPMTWNHTWLSCYIFTWLTLVSPDSLDGRKLAVAGVRAFVVYSLIGAGIQKAMHGSYFQGEFIASRGWQFAKGPLGGLLFSEADVAKFSNVDDIWTGIRLVPESFLLKLSANIVWIGEIIAGVLLLIPRTFRWGLALVAAIMVPIQLSTLEFGFLGILLAGLIAYVPPKWLRAAPVALFFYCVFVFIVWQFEGEDYLMMEFLR